FSAAVLAVQHHVADLHVDGDALGARVVETAGTHRENLALLGLLLRGVRDDKPGRGGLLSLQRLHYDAVLKGREDNLGGGRHDLTSPSGKGYFGDCLRDDQGGLPSRVSDLPRRD